ncbi:MAG TPA: hypothetical protein VJC13_01670 [Candidatus Paceibacterota bacterium]
MVRYKMRVIRGAFTDPTVLDQLNAVIIEKYDRDEWISIDEVVVTLDEVEQLQKLMIKHYDDPDVPWYMDGYQVDDKNKMIVAFGADDGEGGRIFQFDRSDKNMMQIVAKYGVLKGIPAEQMDFGEIDF